MREAHFSTRVRHHIDDVWSFLSDPSRDPLWHTEISHTELVLGTAGSIGSRYRHHYTWNEIEFDATIEIHVAEKPSHLVIVGDELGYRICAEYDLSADGDDTLVDVHLSMQILGTLQLIAPFAWSLASQWTLDSMDSLEAAIGPPGGAKAASG